MIYSGIIDTFNFFGKVFGSIFLMFYPLKRPKRAYTIQAILHTAVLFAVFYIIHEIHSTAKVLLMLGMLFSSACRAFTVVPRVINFNHSNPETDSFLLSFWFILSLLGDIGGILLVQYLMAAGVHWNYAFMAYMALFLMISLLH